MTENTTEYVWTPPEYKFNEIPTKRIVLGLSETSTKPAERPNFARSAKWCADGSALLSHCEDNAFCLYDLRSHISTNFTTSEHLGSPTDINVQKTFRQPSPVVDYVWYPTATPMDPASFCFMASVRECPVKLLDASDGRLRASYRIVDHRERQIAPNSMAFNMTGQRLYCGFEDAIEIFDVGVPGEGTRLHTTPSKKSKEGLKGIVSALAFAPSHTADPGVFAAGSFTPTSYNICLYSEQQEEPLFFLDGGPGAGVTQLRFNPMKPHILYAAYRGNSAAGSVYAWDLRGPLNTPTDIFRVPRTKAPRTNNQRLHFDVDITGRWLATGDHDGYISTFGLDDSPMDLDHIHSPTEDREVVEHEPTLRFKAQDDTVGSVAFCPTQTALASVSGSRHFVDDYDSSSDEDDEGDNEPVALSTYPRPLDASLAVWNCS